MNEHYTHIHLYVEKYDRYEQFLLLDFVDEDEFSYFAQRLDFPIQSIDDEKTMLLFEHIYFRKVHPKEGKIYAIPVKDLISLRWVKPSDDEFSSSVVAFRFSNSEENFILSDMFNRPVSGKRFRHKVSETSDWYGAPCGAEKLSPNIKVIVKKVGQGSWNEIYSNDKCNIVFEWVLQF